MQLTTSEFTRNAKAAVLVDGENISSQYAGQILGMATGLGTPMVRRVYGNATAAKGWDNLPGFKFVHTGCGKNSADMKLAIDAMELACDGECSSFAIVTSDGDFSHLAFALAERGAVVLGIGEGKAPETFRSACSGFRIVTPPDQDGSEIAEPDELAGFAAQLIDAEGGKKGMTVQRLGVRMYQDHKIRISDIDEKNWRAFLQSRPAFFDIEGAGPQAKVRLTGRAMQAVLA